MSDNYQAPGLPSAEVLQSYRIWDSYFTPAHSHPGTDGFSRLISDIERALSAVRKGRFERLCYFAHVGLGTTIDSDLERLLHTRADLVLKPIQRWPELLIGMIQLNANKVDASRDAINRWITDGPMKGVYFSGGGPGALPCTHRNCRQLVEHVIDAGGAIMQHTWFKTGGKQGPGESTPDELAIVARDYPDQQFMCAHAGGEWEKGIRAVQDVPNISVETSGFDATAGFIEMAVQEIGADRIIFGSHLPSRSLGTELGKVLAASISEHDRRQILGQNYRELLEGVSASA